MARHSASVWGVLCSFFIWSAAMLRRFRFFLDSIGSWSHVPNKFHRPKEIQSGEASPHSKLKRSKAGSGLQKKPENFPGQTQDSPKATD
jgi:hypothetical protein